MGCKRIQNQRDLNPRASKRTREELGTTVEAKQDEDTQMPGNISKTRSKIPHSLREEICYLKESTKTIPETGADLAEPVFAHEGQEGIKTLTNPRSFGGIRGQKISEINGATLGANQGESGKVRTQGSSAKSDIRDTQESQATVFLTSVDTYTLDQSTEEGVGALRDLERTKNPRQEAPKTETSLQSSQSQAKANSD